MASGSDNPAALRPGRWLQFSLRSLVVVVLLSGLFLGRYGIRRLEMAREREAIAELQRYGADVQFHEGRAVGVSFSGAGFHADAIAAMGRLPRLQRLVFIDTALDDAALKRISALEGLQQLLVLHADITDDGLRHLAHLRNLRTLRLDQTQVTDEGLRHVSRLPYLERLDLAGARITDAGLAPLADLPRLKQLFLSGAPVTDAGIQSLQERLPHAKIVR